MSVATITLSPPDEKVASPRTPSGIALPLVATARDHTPDDGLPGEYPFTRGISPDGYRGRCGQCGNMPASAPPRSRTSATGSCSTRVRPGCRSRWIANTVRLRPGPSHGAAGGRQSRRLAVQPLGDGAPVQGHRSRPDIDVVHHQWHRGDHLRHVHRLRRQAGRATRQATGTIQNDILKEYVARGTWISRCGRRCD